MTLFDKQPITAEEIQSRILCECGHSHWHHFHGTSWLAAFEGGEDRKGMCSRCDCDEFREAEAGS